MMAFMSYVNVWCVDVSDRKSPWPNPLSFDEVDSAALKPVFDRKNHCPKQLAL